MMLLTRFCKLLTTAAILSGEGYVPQVPQWHDASDFCRNLYFIHMYHMRKLNFVYKLDLNKYPILVECGFRYKMSNEFCLLCSLYYVDNSLYRKSNQLFVTVLRNC